ncbi:MAG: hypothetical protein ETSY1_37645 [Candidatus Entotheonella factor]|uniref:Type II secretion system protein GspN n=1 Tax=Entotheonella factor TaxID=1429438 RepID=W4L913_ENTF1|nr:MAG: hypothetical protein ETSY1_37645 [Candidatus Entotheonella factor]
MWRTIFKISAYVIYGLAAFIVFVYLLLPYDLLRQRAVEYMSQGPIKLDIASLSPALLPGLNLRNVRVSLRQPNTSPEVLYLQTLRTWPHWLSLLSPAKRFGFTGQLYNGRISGSVQYTQRDGTTDWDINLENVDVSRHALLQEMQQKNQLTVEGRLSGTANTRFTKTGQLAQGDIDFDVQPAIFTPGALFHAIVPNPIPCDNLKGTAVRTRREWQIQGVTCQGDDILIDLRGTLRPRGTWNASVPNLRITAKSDSAFRTELNNLSQLAIQRPLGEDGEVKFGLRGRLDNLRPVR